MDFLFFFFSFFLFMLHFRMLSKVKIEVETFGVALDDLDFLDQVVQNLERLFALGFFQVIVIFNIQFLSSLYLKNSIMKINIRDTCSQRLFQADSPLSSSLNIVMCNKKLLDALSSCFHEGCCEILLRLGKLLFPIVSDFGVIDSRNCICIFVPLQSLSFLIDIS